jgi:hypothetical protein
MEAVEQEDTEMDLDAKLVAENGDAIDAAGGFQVQNGPYIEQLDCRGDNDESSVDGSEDPDSLLGGSDGGCNSEYESHNETASADVDDFVFLPMASKKSVLWMSERRGAGGGSV